MKVEYMRTAKKSYMIVKGADFPYEPYELSMILRNDIACLIPFQVILEDGRVQYWYEVGGMQSLKNAFSMNSLDGKQLRILLESLVELKSEMEAYLLDDANICFRADTVCFDRAREKIRFCYIPGLGAAEEGSAVRGLKKLFEDILKNLDHSDPAAVRMGYEMYERCSRAPYTVEDCMDCLRLADQTTPDSSGGSIGEQDILWGPVPEPADEPEKDRHGTLEDTADDLEFLLEESGQRPTHRRKRKRGRADRLRESGPDDADSQMRAIECREDESLTEIISASFTVKTWELVYKGKGVESDLAIAEFPFLVGTDKSRVDGVIRARTVSRVHAKLYMKEGKLFVEDFNSTNGTYLNQNLLPMSTPAEIKEGDRIVFATEEYILFCRYG